MKQHFQEQERIVNTPKRHNQHFPTYRPFGHHWLAGTSASSLLWLDLCFVAILLLLSSALCTRRLFLLLLPTHPKIAIFPQFVLILAAKLSAIILAVQNAAAAVWFGSNTRQQQRQQQSVWRMNLSPGTAQQTNRRPPPSLLLLYTLTQPNLG